MEKENKTFMEMAIQNFTWSKNVWTPQKNKDRFLQWSFYWLFAVNFEHDEITDEHDEITGKQK